MNDQDKLQNQNQELRQLVSFHIANEEFGVDILKVQEIIKIISITKVPNSPVFVEGVINLRGRIIPVIDLRTRLGIPKKEHDKSTRIIVVDLKGKTVGFIVDSVSEVLRIQQNIIEAPPDIVSGIDSEYITAVGKLTDRLLILLDLEKVFTENESTELSKKFKEVI
jgi:purine-binding chemotaxis protein CheW